MRWGHWGKKRLRNWPMFTQPVAGLESGFEPRYSGIWVCALIICPTIGKGNCHSRHEEEPLALRQPGHFLDQGWGPQKAGVGWPTVLKATTTLLRQGLEFISSSEYLLRASEIYQDVWDPAGMHRSRMSCGWNATSLASAFLAQKNVGDFLVRADFCTSFFFHYSVWWGYTGKRKNIYFDRTFFPFCIYFFLLFQIFLLFNFTHILPTTQEDNWWDYVCSEKGSDYATTPEEEFANESWWQEPNEFPFPLFS